jgi:D-glycero-D-manno-heptose 1,7-bisphosphate phosphatase
MKNEYLVVLDRDGVINVDHGHVHSIDRFEFIDGIFEFCRIAIARDCMVVVATNQAGIARGLFTEGDFEKLNVWMLQSFLDQGVEISHVFYCPHHPDFSEGLRAGCQCRKPEPGMLIKALEFSSIQAENAVFIGDKNSDILAGKAANFGRTIKIGDPSSDASQNFSSIREMCEYSKLNWII